MNKNYVHYGCGIFAPEEWQNFDVSPTLRIQKIPVLGKITKKIHHVDFPKNVRYGNILKGLPGVSDNSCEGVFCSHVLEHLTLDQFHIALENSYRYLKVGGKFRCIVPDLKYYIDIYIEEYQKGNISASFDFMKKTHLGYENSPKGLLRYIRAIYGTAKHKWMWDKNSLERELRNVGFSYVRECHYGDSEDRMFTIVEHEGRYKDAIAFECVK